MFSVAELDGGGRVCQRRDLKRDAFVAWLVQLPPGTVMAMEACSGAHHWARRCLEYGLVPSGRRAGKDRPQPPDRATRLTMFKRQSEQVASGQTVPERA